MIKDLGPINNTSSKNSYQYIPKAYVDVAKGMEKQFLNYMLEQMKKTTEEKEGDTSSQYYNSLMTSERAGIMSEQNEGMGISKLILDQIYPKHLRNEIQYQQFLNKEQGKIVKNQNAPKLIEKFKNTDVTNE